MKFLLNENVSREVKKALRDLGHEAEMARDVLGPGATDTSILEKAVREGSIIITADQRFGDLVFKGGRHHVGVVLLRLKDQKNRPEKFSRHRRPADWSPARLLQ